MYNHNIWDIKDNDNWIIITTWIQWRSASVKVPISYSLLNDKLLDYYNLDILNFIKISREKWWFEIDYNEDKSWFKIYSSKWNLEL